MKSSTGEYLSRIDHLRFFAATIVFFWHFLHGPGAVPLEYVPAIAPLSVLEEGHTGVSLFLVLSGFLFTRAALGRSINGGAFYRNRMLRVFPLLAFWCAYFAWTGGFDEVTWFQLIHPGRTPGVLWTIVVECQFYLVFPLLIAMTNRFGARFLFALLVIALVARALVWQQAGTIQSLSYWTLIGRIDQFLIGMLCAVATKQTWFVAGRSALLLLSVGAVLIIASLHAFNTAGGFYGIGGFPSPSAVWVALPTVEGVAYAALLAGYLAMPVRLPRWLDRALSTGGELSYSLYLNQVLTIALVGYGLSYYGVSPTSFGEALALGAFVGLPVLILASALTYALVERPFLKLRSPWLGPVMHHENIRHTRAGEP